MIDQRVLKPTPGFMTYSLAKAGLWALTRTSAQALMPSGDGWRARHQLMAASMSVMWMPAIVSSRC